MVNSAAIITAALLALLSLAGYYCTWIVTYRNGFFPLAAKTVESLIAASHEGAAAGGLGNTTPLKTVYTGIRSVDDFLTLLTLLFWPCFDGSAPQLSLQAFHFAGQLLAFWTILEIEARRVGNRWRLVSLLPIWGVIMQAVTFTVTIPLYLALHLLTSPASLALTPRDAAASSPATNLLLSSLEVWVLPISVSLGCVLPEVLAGRTFLAPDTRQTFLALWQVFPLCTYLIQRVLTATLAALFPRSYNGAVYHSTAERDAGLLRALRSTYAFAFCGAAVSHIAAWTLSLESVLLPDLFHPDITSSSLLHPKRVFAPPSPVDITPPRDLAEGFHRLLLFAEYIGSFAFVVWALVINRFAYTTSVRAWAAHLRLLVTVAVLTLFSGPAGAAVWLVWQRDELVLGTGQYEPEKKTI